MKLKRIERRAKRNELTCNGQVCEVYDEPPLFKIEIENLMVHDAMGVCLNGRWFWQTDKQELLTSIWEDWK